MPRRRRRPRVPSRQGACGPARRMCASRWASSCRASVPARTAAIASATASNTGSPSPRCSTRSSHHRSASGSPRRRGEGGERIGWRRRAAPALVAAPPATTASGRSIARTVDAVLGGPAHGLPLRAERGERREHRPLGLGDDVARAGPPAARARAGRSTAARRSASAGASTSTTSGRIASSARRTRPRRARAVVADAERCRWRLQAIVSRVAAGVVELAPAVAVPDHTLEVLAPRHVVVQGVAHDGADDAAGDVVGAQRAVAEVGGEGEAVGDHRDRLGRRQRAGRRLQAGAAVGGDAGAQLAEDRDDAADLVGRGRHVGQRAARRRARPTRWATMAISSSAVAGSGSTTVLKRRRSALDSSLTPRSRSLAVAMRLKPWTAGDLGVELGDRQHLLRQDGDQGVLHLGGHAGQLLDADEAPGAHRPVDRAGHQRRLAGALGEQPGVVPAVAQRLLGGAGGALHEQGRVAADGGGEVLADPGLGRARHAEQEQGAVGGERGDGDLDEPARRRRTSA